MSLTSLTHLTHFYPRFKTLSGGETAILNLTAELAQMGVKSTILTRGYVEVCDVLLHPSVEIRTVNRPWNWVSNNHLLDSFLDVWFAPAELSLLPQETDGFIFHSEASPFALWWAKKLHRTSKPCVYFCYQPPRFAYDLLDSTVSGFTGLGRLAPLYAPLHRWVDRQWVRQADAVWTFSKAYGDWCKELYNLLNVVCIPPGINFDYFSSGDANFVAQKWNIPANTITLVTVNKLIPRKNIDVFIEVVRWLRDAGHRVKGIIAGNGPARPQLEALAQQADVMNEIIFAGYISDEELPHYYAGADVYLFLERNVPFGMTPLEAAAAGTPSIAPRGGGALETIVHGKTGFLVDESLPISEIAQCILDLGQSEAAQQQMREQAKAHAREFTWRRYAQQVCDSFIEVNRNAS